jgi:hypothetical protein
MAGNFILPLPNRNLRTICCWKVKATPYSCARTCYGKAMHSLRLRIVMPDTSSFAMSTVGVL